MKPHSPTLIAQDPEDLEILSARLQDAVAKTGELVYLPKKHRFAALLNRYRWEDAKRGAGKRVRSRLSFESVLSAQARNIKLGAKDAVVSLLALRFEPKGDAENPAGIIELVFSGGGSVRLDVECIDAALSDVTAEWTALGRPAHEGEA